eukprot:TRINITY_DN19099_c0_g1_i1.p1 TRINITY_DN19099_c0_g1~~TRINITY_DN19099_c0_g1_i1.p1  ORF type:complete len:363 (-),score=63.25 TRINITY_DN19099_c0_g1_i1:72-1160(-)
MDAATSVEDALRCVPRLATAEAYRLAAYLRSEAYEDVQALREARAHPEEWQQIDLPLRVKCALWRLLDESRRGDGALSAFAASAEAPSSSSTSGSQRTPGAASRHRLASAPTALSDAGGLLPVSLDALVAIGAWLGPAGLATAGTCSLAWRGFVSGSACEAVWRLFAGASALPLLSNETSSMRRFLQLARLRFRGTWLDTGTDGNERYRFLSAVRELRRPRSDRPLERRLDAISLLQENYIKYTYANLTGAMYIGYERFTTTSGGTFEPLLNMAAGILDLREPERPRIFGSWLQYNPVADRGRRRQRGGLRSGWGLNQPRVVGTFEFIKIDSRFDEQAGRKRCFREMAGLSDDGPLYEVEPL